MVNVALGNIRAIFSIHHRQKLPGGFERDDLLLFYF